MGRNDERGMCMRYEDYEEAYDDEDLRSDCDDHEIFWWRVCKEKALR